MLLLVCALALITITAIVIIQGISGEDEKGLACVYTVVMFSAFVLFAIVGYV
jgi:hypothetical protein